MLTYTRATIETLTKETDRSLIYWRSQARKTFASRSDINTIHIARSGRKTPAIESGILTKGSRHAKPSEAVFIASTGGKWGKSRRNFWPA